MTSNHIKNQILSYYRFNRGVSYVATECWECDVVVYDSKTEVLTEIEVKTSWEDYKADFQKSKYKVMGGDHERYVIFGSNHHSPHLKYFAAPTDLADRIMEDLSAKNSPFGVLRIPKYGDPMVIRRGRKLKNGKMTPRGIDQIVMRMGSELITVRKMVRPGDTPIKDRFITHHREEDWGKSHLLMDMQGKATLTLYQYGDDESTVYLSSLHVVTEFRKQGIGNELLYVGEERGRAMGANTIWLWVERGSWMHDWYLRKGYQDGDQKDPTHIWMRKSL